MRPPASRWHVGSANAHAVFDDIFRLDLLAQAILLNLTWMALAICVYLLLFRSARNRGLLLLQV